MRVLCESGYQDQALHLARAQTRVSVPHQLSPIATFELIAVTNVAQTLLSVLVRLGRIAKITKRSYVAGEHRKQTHVPPQIRWIRDDLDDRRAVQHPSADAAVVRTRSADQSRPHAGQHAAVRRRQNPQARDDPRP